MNQALSMGSEIAHPSRLRSASGLPVAVPLWEIALLAASGALAAVSVGLLELRLRIPGHSILNAVLPMAFGLALAPRRYAGAGMSLAAITTAFGLQWAGRGEFGAGSWTSLASMGPALDFMLGSRWGQRWPSFSVAVAGLLANSCAFLAKAAEKWTQATATPSYGIGRGQRIGLGGGGMGGGRGIGDGMGRTWDEWIAVAPYSYLLCGLLAGLLCGIALFHLRRRNGGSQSTSTPADATRSLLP